MNEIVFLVSESPEGGYVAEAAGHSIFTDPVLCHFEEERPKTIRLHFEREEVIAV
jgi:hypothetical protein